MSVDGFVDWIFQSTLPLRGATGLTFTSANYAIFQSTLPLRGATRIVMMTFTSRIFQSTLPLRGATNLMGTLVFPLIFQSTLPLRGATTRDSCKEPSSKFQSTLPLRGATVHGGRPGGGYGISIHAPLAGSDRVAYMTYRERMHFNPRSPCGERPTLNVVTLSPLLFQSTLPLRGATC